MKNLSIGVLVMLLTIIGAFSAPTAGLEGQELGDSDFISVSERGGPGSSSWPPSWRKSSEKRTLLVRGGPGSSSWPPSWLESSDSESKRTISERGGPGSSSWPPSWKTATEDSPTLLTRGGPGSSSWPPSWMKTETRPESESSKRTLLVRGGPGSSSWPPSWLKSSDDDNESKDGAQRRSPLSWKA
ncbi:hypothetical protein GYMLUDRAFT_237343 [Collybiopsis luxurians FD-317 M1]|nr:hypothetical protein GYMLUDRAFT_237343 [Collybiopsis luxurians FD-317 M1]